MKKYKKKNITKLNKALQLARDCNDLLCVDILLHNIKAWKREIPNDLYYFWLNHSDATNAYDWKEYYNDNCVYPFTLPLPKVEFM